MEIRWTDRATDHLAAAFAFLSEENSSAAEKQVGTMFRAINQLVNFPEMGRYGRVRGTRELVIQTTPYVVAYRLKRGTVEILALLHGARRWPNRFEES